MAKEIVLTVEGREKLLEELEYLETEKRAEVGQRIKVAREFGDISENSEYVDAKNEQSWVESRILEITDILAHSTVVETPKRSSKVSIGQTVTLEDAKGKELVVTLVGTTEADPVNGRISNESPMGQALIGNKKGDVIEVQTPSGKVNKYTIMKVASK